MLTQHKSETEINIGSNRNKEFLKYYNELLKGKTATPADPNEGPFGDILKQQRAAILAFNDFEMTRLEFDASLRLESKRLQAKQDESLKSIIDELDAALLNGNTAEAQQALTKSRAIK